MVILIISSSVIELFKASDNSHHLLYISVFKYTEIPSSTNFTNFIHTSLADSIHWTHDTWSDPQYLYWGSGDKTNDSHMPGKWF